MMNTWRTVFELSDTGVVMLSGMGTVLYSNRKATQWLECSNLAMTARQGLGAIINAARDGLLNLPFCFSLPRGDGRRAPLDATLLAGDMDDTYFLVVKLAESSAERMGALEEIALLLHREGQPRLDRLIEAISAMPRHTGDAAAAELEEAAADVVLHGAAMKHLVDRMVAGQMEETRRARLTDLLYQALLNSEPAVQRRQIRWAMSGHEQLNAVVYVARDRMNRALGEFFAFLIDRSPPGSTIELSLTCSGETVELAAHLPALPSHAEASVSAFAPLAAAGATHVPHAPAANELLGMSFCRRVLESHGGSLRVERRFDGTDLTLTFPVGAAKAKDGRMALRQVERLAEELPTLLARHAQAGAGRSAALNNEARTV